MQNRYTGDIGDFGKLGLLRRISESGFSIGVNCYLTPDESHNGDGRHIGYLRNEAFRVCDEQLWRVLGDIVESGRREEWHSRAKQLLQGCDIVFTDPDNGLIVPSEEGTKKENKFVLPMELAEYYSAGASVIYYQHKARRTDDFYTMQHRNLLGCGAFPGAKGLGLKFKTTSQRYYFS